VDDDGLVVVALRGGAGAGAGGGGGGADVAAVAELLRESASTAEELHNEV